MSRHAKPQPPKPKYKKAWRAKVASHEWPNLDDELHYSEWGFNSYEEMVDYFQDLHDHHDPDSGFELDIGGQA